MKLVFVFELRLTTEHPATTARIFMITHELQSRSRRSSSAPPAAENLGGRASGSGDGALGTAMKSARSAQARNEGVPRRSSVRPAGGHPAHACHTLLALLRPHARRMSYGLGRATPHSIDRLNGPRLICVIFREACARSRPSARHHPHEEDIPASESFGEVRAVHRRESSSDARSRDGAQPSRLHLDGTSLSRPLPRHGLPGQTGGRCSSTGVTRPVPARATT